VVEDGSGGMRNNGFHLDAMADRRPRTENNGIGIWDVILIAASGIVSVGLMVWFIVAIVLGVISLLS
jgi:fatty acid desaturase